VLVFLAAVSTAEPVVHTSALERVPDSELPAFQDDGDRGVLEAAVDRSLLYYRALPADRVFVIGAERRTATRMISALERFRELLHEPPAVFRERLKKEFFVYRSTGAGPQGTVVYSAYYEHTLDASLTPDETYRYPLYRPPKDLLKRTDPNRPELTKWGRLLDGKFVPYFTRTEIDSDGVLKGKGLEIAWAKDPMDIFFLQVQGSGWLSLPDGRSVRIRYAAHNERPFVSVGGRMIAKGLIPREKFSRETMAAYMKAHPEKRQDLLNENPRYVFFEIDMQSTGSAVGALDVELTPGRSIATDHSLFPPGALAWMETEGKYRLSRFVLNQDQGGAIKGPGRVDYFVGAGKEAEAYAVRFWQPGRLYFLIDRTR
jgi:membrane-bound lytic murein transglycosylase A